MSVPLKTIFQPTELSCTTQGCSAQLVELHYFAASFVGKSDPICLACLSGEIELTTELEDTTPADGPRKKVLRRQKKLSQQQERDIAEELGGKVNKASGAMAHAKGDVRKKGHWRVEAKYTEASSYRLTLDDLYKLAGECSDLERPIFIIDFRKKGGRQLDRFAVVQMTDLKEMIDGIGPHP